MSNTNTHTVLKNTLSSNIKEHTGVATAKCYQCGKCSAGCPVVKDMDYSPSLLLRMLQIESEEMDEKVLRSYSIWLCLNCEMCIGRCPQEVDIPKAMDYLRNVSLKKNKQTPKAKNIIKFHRAFMDSVNYTGRLYEMGLIADYKSRSLNITQDVGLAPAMFAKGKLSIFPELIKDRKNMKKIFNKTLKKSTDHGPQSTENKK